MHIGIHYISQKDFQMKKLRLKNPALSLLIHHFEDFEASSFYETLGADLAFERCIVLELMSW